MNPEWIAAGASAATALENGVSTLRKSGDKPAPEPPAPLTAFQGVTNTGLIAASLIIGGALFLAILLHAMIMHHALTP